MNELVAGQDVARLFLDFSIRKLEQLASRIEACLALLPAEQIWARSNPIENAVGNLVLHLCGNVRQWIGHGVGGLADVRERAGEFQTRDGISAAELASQLKQTVHQAIEILRALPPERLTETTTLQGYEVSLLEAIYHVVEHFAQHTGQIIYVTKRVTGRDLGFYRHLEERAAHYDTTP